jgi:tripartite-type tricarboxylate transporter receptor subunit TctC
MACARLPATREGAPDEVPEENKKMRRRTFLAAAAGGIAIAAGAAVATPAFAQATSWPDKPVRVIVPYAAGGATDAIARPWCDELSKALGQQFVVENRGGASGMIGTEATAKAAPDGYTLIMSPNAPLTVLPSLKKTAYDPVKDLVPIGRTGDVTNGFVIHPSIGAKTFKEFVAYAKANPGKLMYASSGNGTANHLRLEALKLKLGLDILHVPYRGGADSLNDLLPGNVHMMNEPITLPHVKAGKLHLLVINGPVRNPDFPDVPTLKEEGVEGADVPIWFGFYGPAGLPKPIVDKMNGKMRELLGNAEFKAKLWKVNAIAPLQTPEEMAKSLADDIAANLAIIKAANIKIE